jgi:hypothetical protein
MKSVSFLASIFSALKRVPKEHKFGNQNNLLSTVDRQLLANNLLPLNRSRWLGGNVVDHAVDSLDTVDDVIGHLG